jgi:uncharacterized membrane protein YfcA
MIETLLPPGVSPGFALVLVLASAVTSALTGALGLGGGIALLALMAQGLPVAAVIPVHGVAQLGSNAGRAVVQRRHVERRTLLVYSLGAVVGALLGALVVVSLPEPALRIGLALFIGWAVFGTRPKLTARGSDGLMAAGGVISSFASMFFGATGPITMAFLATRGLVKHALVGTHAATMVVQHGLKIAAFGTLGFAYGPWIPLLAAIVASGLVGTLVGARLLDRLPDRWFEAGFKIVMALLALDLLRQGLAGLWA